MKKTLLLFACAALLAACCCNENKKQIAHYEPTWESLSDHEEIPQWLADGKLGIYFHWGLYNVPDYQNAWYPYFMYRHGNKGSIYEYHNEKYGKNFEYHQFADMLTGEYFDAKDWAKLFKEAGARFAGPCAIHHDGFAMWDSEVNPFNAADRGPKCDITGELLAALKEEGLKTITTFHHSRNHQRSKNDPGEWADQGKDCAYTTHFAYDTTRATSSTDPDLAKFYGNLPEEEFQQYWFDQVKEVVDQYSPDIIWFDSWFNLIPEWNRQKMAAYYYNEAIRKKQDVTIGYKQDDLPIEVGILDIEQGGKKELSERVWMTDITIGETAWSYLSGQKYKTPALLIRNMIDVWSKNGIVLLNVSPTTQGVIPDEQRTLLHTLGQWLGTHAEAVYGT